MIAPLPLSFRYKIKKKMLLLRSYVYKIKKGFSDIAKVLVILFDV